MTQDLKRGEFAKQSGVGFETIRYYERRGLLPKAQRSTGGYRLYSEQDVRRVKFIKRAQDLGFTLKEVTDLLTLRVSKTTTCSDVMARAQTKLDDIDEKIKDLQEMKSALSSLLDQCSGKGPATECPILDSLEAVSAK